MSNFFKKEIHRVFRKNETELHVLNYLFWECTQRCNLACRHCGSDCIADSKVKDMPFADFLQAVLPLKSAYEPDSITVVITGGEPLVRKDLAECGKTLRDHGFRWGIVTNGYMYTAETHARLLSAGMGALTLSLDGFEENHNWLRANKNSFSNAVQALDLVVSSGRLNYDVVTCVNRRNIHDLERFKEFLISKRVKAWRLFTIAPIGRAANQDDMQLSADELKLLMEFIADARSDKRIDTKFSCEGYVGKYEWKVRDSGFFCRAGINIGSVLVDGSISACPNINRHYVQGNIYKDDFMNVWNNRFQTFRNRQWMRKGVCADCEMFRHCEGSGMHLRDENGELLVCHCDRIN